MKSPGPSSSLLKWTTSYFSSHAIDNPRSTAEVLLAHALKLKRIDLYLQYDRPMHADELKDYKALIKRRIAREPVAYITGTKEFWSLDFQVTRDVLIPRPETECLVEASLEVMGRKRRHQTAQYPGTGYGFGSNSDCPGQPRARPLLFCLGYFDRSAGSGQGEQRCPGAAQDSFFCRGLAGTCSSVPKPVLTLLCRIRRIFPKGISVACSPRSIGMNPSGRWMERMTGSDVYGASSKQRRSCLVPGGVLLLEIGYGQREEVEAIARQGSCFDEVSFDKDYSGIHRVARLRKAAPNDHLRS